MWRLRWLFLVILHFCFAPQLSADCNAPHYQVGKTYDYTAPTVLLDISIPLEDFTPDKLICLATVLKQRYRGPEVAVNIFSSHKAAVNYVPLGVERQANAVLWASQQHAQYYFNAEKHEEYLLLMPDALSINPKSPFNTRIDLPVTAVPSCRLQVYGRCLLAFDHIAATSEDGSRTVTLTAQIEQNGSVSHVRRANPDGIVSGEQRALTDFALKNLRSWRFEPSKTKGEISITYSLEWVQAPLKNGVDVRFILPNAVNIQMSRSLLMPTPPPPD